jgi:hypothetical protein
MIGSAPDNLKEQVKVKVSERRNVNELVSSITSKVLKVQTVMNKYLVVDRSELLNLNLWEEFKTLHDSFTKKRKSTCSECHSSIIAEEITLNPKIASRLTIEVYKNRPTFFVLIGGIEGYEGIIDTAKKYAAKIIILNYDKSKPLTNEVIDLEQFLQDELNNSQPIVSTEEVKEVVKEEQKHSYYNEPLVLPETKSSPKISSPLPQKKEQLKTESEYSVLGIQESEEHKLEDYLKILIPVNLIPKWIWIMVDKWISKRRKVKYFVRVYFNTKENALEAKKYVLLMVNI